MTAPRARCSAAGRFRDQHQCVDTWWTVRVPNGDEYDFCSTCCVLEFVCLVELPSEVEAGRQDREAA